MTVLSLSRVFLFVLMVNVNMVRSNIGQVFVQLHCCFGNNYFSINANGQKSWFIMHLSNPESALQKLLEHPELTILRGEKISQNGNSIIRLRASTLY